MKAQKPLTLTLSVVLLLTTTLTSLLSCKKNKDASPVNPTSSIIKEIKNGDDLMRFSYNADGTVSKVVVNNYLITGGFTTEYIVSYGANNKISELVGSDGRHLVAHYDEANALSRVDILVDGLRMGYTTYNFVDGKINLATMYFKTEQGFDPYMEFSYAYDNAGNTSSLTVLMELQPGTLKRIGSFNFQYDQKQNPLKNHADLLAFFWEPANKNNITVEETFDVIYTLEERNEYSYTYNSNGFPTQAAMKTITSDTTINSTVIYTY